MKSHQEHPNLDRGLLKGVFLVLLFILGHTVTPTYSKRLFTLIEKNDILKHIILIWVIYFSIDFADKSLKHPIETFKQSIFIWVVYLMVSKQRLQFVLLNLLLLSIIYTINQYKEYDIQEQDKLLESQHDKQLDNYIDIMLYLLAFTILYGFYDYYQYKKLSKKSQFKLVKFIFGSKV